MIAYGLVAFEDTHDLAFFTKANSSKLIIDSKGYAVCKEDVT